jgi:hypothetical protein
VALRQRLGEDVFRSWLGKVGVVSIGEELVLSAPSRFIASHVRSNFETAIVEAWQVQHAVVSRLRVEVAAAAVTAITSRLKAGEQEDARWLVDVGIDIVADRMRLPRDGGGKTADKTILGWLKRCGRDVAGLRRIIEQAAVLDLDEGQFENVVKQRTKALLFADQQPMEFLRRPEMVRKRSGW